MKLNKVQLTGNIVRDLELKESQNGTKYTFFTLAVDKSYKDKNGEWQNRAIFVFCYAHGLIAERFATLRKGDRIYIEGELDQQEVEKDNEKHTRTRVIAYNFQVIKKLTQQADTPKQNTPKELEDDIPF